MIDASDTSLLSFVQYCSSTILSLNPIITHKKNFRPFANSFSKRTKACLSCYHPNLLLFHNNNLIQYTCIVYCCAITGAPVISSHSAYLFCSKTIFYFTIVPRFQQFGFSINNYEMYSSFQRFLSID